MGNKRSASIFALTCALLLISLRGWSVDVNVGDEIELTKDAPLFFLKEHHRDGTVGEKFKVLAYKPDEKRIFLLANDNGREIALSVDEAAVTVVTRDFSALCEQVRVSAQIGSFADAHRMLNSGLGQSPSDSKLLQASEALNRAEISSKVIADAKAVQVRTRAEAARIRKNAGVVDRPNLLAPGDNSNQQRAERMRREADEMETRANTVVEKAEAGFKAALSAISTKAGQNTAKASPAGFNQQPKDDEGIPPILSPTDDVDSYKDALEFINNKLVGGWKKIWFSKRAGKMIVQGDYGVAVFNAADLSPDIKFSPVPLHTPAGSQFLITVEARNGRKAIELQSTGKVQPGPTSGLKFYASDPVDQKKLVNAFSSLIQMLGGRPDAFSDQDR